MNTAIQRVNHAVHLPSVVVGKKNYQFLPDKHSSHEAGFSGCVTPFLCTYIFFDDESQPLATIRVGTNTEPSLMDASWNNQLRMPVFKPEFSRFSELGLNAGDPEYSATKLLDVCRKAHFEWSSNYADSQLKFDSRTNSISVFSKTFLLSHSSAIDKSSKCSVYHDPIEGFIFLNESNEPLFALSKCGDEKYFCSASRVGNRNVASFALNEHDLGAMGGQQLLEVHREEIAVRLFDLLSQRLGVAS